MSTGGTGTGRPPPAVVAAAALAGLQALFCLLPGLSGLSLGVNGRLDLLALGLLYLVLSAGAVYGAVLAVRGRNGRVLTVVGVASAVVWAVNEVLSVVTGLGFDVLSALLLAIAVAVVVFMRRPDVVAWTTPAT
ncbi:MAG: hypothetical protein JWQ53_341 [Klenkia sp.]|nr:hypothetical protein [Klenkia sp.]